MNRILNSHKIYPYYCILHHTTLLLANNCSKTNQNLQYLPSITLNWFCSTHNRLTKLKHNLSIIGYIYIAPEAEL